MTKANIDLVGQESGVVTNKYYFGDGGPECQNGAAPSLQKSRTREVLAESETLICADFSEDTSYAGFDTFVAYGLRSQISIPMVSKEKAVGILHLRDKEISAYEMQEKMLLARVVNRITPGVVNAVLYEETVRARETLQKYTEELDRSNAEVEQFAYVASHALQDPLRSIVGFTSLLTRRYTDQLDDEAGTRTESSVRKPPCKD